MYWYSHIKVSLHDIALGLEDYMLYQMYIMKIEHEFYHYSLIYIFLSSIIILYIHTLFEQKYEKYLCFVIILSKNLSNYRLKIANSLSWYKLFK